MSDTPAPLPSAPFFRPVTLLAGVALGLGLLAVAGRLVTRDDWHRDFHRFHPFIAPETLYQPTVAEMCAIIRARCRPGQILVVVGGNSVFQGVGQPVEKLWTRRLQERLGDRYAVVNLAFRGSAPTDAGALAAEALRAEFPHQIYLANVPPFKAASPGGTVEYFLMLLDAPQGLAAGSPAARRGDRRPPLAPRPLPGCPRAEPRRPARRRAALP